MAAKGHVKELAQGTEGPSQAGGPGRCRGRADSGTEPRGGPSKGLTARGGEVSAVCREAERGLVEQRSPRPPNPEATQTVEGGSWFYPKVTSKLWKCGFFN